LVEQTYSATFNYSQLNSQTNSHFLPLIIIFGNLVIYFTYLTHFTLLKLFFIIPILTTIPSYVNPQSPTTTIIFFYLSLHLIVAHLASISSIFPHLTRSFFLTTPRFTINTLLPSIFSPKLFLCLPPLFIFLILISIFLISLHFIFIPHLNKKF